MRIRIVVSPAKSGIHAQWQSDVEAVGRGSVRAPSRIKGVEACLADALWRAHVALGSGKAAIAHLFPMSYETKEDGR